jgi:hypothetical protein
MALPRMNNWSFWILPFAGGILLSTFFMEGGAPAFGWTFYAPLSTTFAQEDKSRLDKLTKHVRNDYDKFEFNNPELKKLYESEQKIALDLYNLQP